MHYLHKTLLLWLFASWEIACLANDPADLSATLDQLVQSGWEDASVQPTPPIDDYGFARRVTLDLAGRIPTIAELNAFVNSDSPDKRQEYVDRLLGMPDFALHLRDTFDLMLLASIKHDQGWREYLLEATQENRPWDKIFQEILVPERMAGDDKRPAAFLHSRAKELDALTNDCSVLLFGINIACAKCHDHPLVDDWKQSHYFGLASFFERTYAMPAGRVSERFDGSLKYTTVSGEEHQAQLMFLTGQTAEEKRAELSKERSKEINDLIRDAQRNADAKSPPLPDFSPRMELVRMALDSRQGNLLARNIVNRTWARLIGRGLVYPLDQMHTENPASHPRLLDALADAFVDSGYDLKALIRALVLSRTYALSSGIEADMKATSEELFARGLLRPLTPRQLSLSLLVATQAPQMLKTENGQMWSKQRLELESRADAIASVFPIPDDGFQVSVDEALRFSNSQQFQAAFLQDDTQIAPDTEATTLLGYLATLAEEDRLIEEAYLAILSRPPQASEVGAIRLYLAQRRDRPTEALRQVVWALLASPETRFNH